MRMSRRAALAGLATLAAAPVTQLASARPPDRDAHNGDDRQVEISTGSLRGRTDGAVTTFAGIPYAAPPTGAFRWRPPQQPRPWTGVREATEFGADCPQPSSGPSPARISSEDCLFANVWRPADVRPGSKLPVMVWIHGGGFVSGSGAEPTFSGEAFARQGIILVTVNYRLGRFGFFAFPALSEERPDEPTGNYAYMDQIAALRWVRQNIEAFGGDPHNITVFGESAGGASVHALLTSPSTRGLFDKAIIESGGGREGTLSGRPLDADELDPLHPVSAETIGVNFARRHGIMGDDAGALGQLRALSADQILDEGAETDGPQGPATFSGPIIDGRVLETSPETVYAAGRQARVPVLIGSNSAEAGSGFISAGSKEELFSQFGHAQQEAISVYDPEGTTELEELLTMVTTDEVWAEPARFTAEAYAAAGLPAYVYRFSYVAETMRDRFPLGAPHASELEFVFDTLASRYGEDVTGTDRAVARMINRCWANFARTGDPGGSGLPDWPRYESTHHPLLDIRPDGTATGAPDPRTPRLDLVERQDRLVTPS